MDVEDRTYSSPVASISGQGNSVDSGHSFMTENDPPLSLIDLLQSSTDILDFSNPPADQYVDQLLSLSLHELLRQPQLISAETSTVESDLINLCFREYPTFISVHKCSSAVSSAFDDFSGSLGKLIDAIPSLEDECKAFSTSTGSIQNVRGKAALVQEHQDKLMDLLELPQLMETCVRNGYYQEAMELLNHCRSLASKYPFVPLIQDVNKEVEGILQLMLAQLLALLREPVKLPALVKTVSFLRRMDALDQNELGLIFISSRYHNYRTQLTLIDRDKADPVRYLRKYIDLFREHVYDIIAQFTAIFLEISPSEVAAIHITSFADQAVTDLVELVTAYIPRIASDSGSMSSILVQLGYCAMSFSRVGLDFAPLVSASFASTVISTFSQSLATASNDFGSILRNSAKAVLPPSQILVVAEHIAHIVSSPTSPPALPSIDTISHYPPLATLMNAYISAFNSLRLLAPLELHSQITSTLSSSLLASTNVLLQYVRQATTLSDEPPMSPVKTRPGHRRTPSTPRADLLRRNSEVLMTADARAAKRREARRVCVACADLWCRMVVPFLVDKLDDGVFADIPKPDPSKDLSGKLEELKSWVRDNEEGSEEKVRMNGNGDASQSLHSVLENDHKPPTTPPRRTIPLASAFDSPSHSSPKTPAIPNLATPTPKPASGQLTPHSNGIEAVFDSPRSSTSTTNGIAPLSSSDPADLQESGYDTVQPMNVQSELMDVGLTGEEAAVAVNVEHDINHHTQNSGSSALELNTDQKPALADAIDLKAERMADLPAERATSAIHAPYPLDTLDNITAESLNTVKSKDELPSTVAPDQAEPNFAPSSPIVVEIAPEPTTDAVDINKISLSSPSQALTPVIEPSKPMNSQIFEAREDTRSNDLPQGQPASAEAKTPHKSVDAVNQEALKAPISPAPPNGVDVSLEDQMQRESTEGNKLKIAESSGQPTDDTAENSHPAETPEDISAPDTPIELESHPASTNPSRPVSPDGEAEKQTAVTSGSSGGGAKKKKKKKGKK
ncbi:uncharacterized protein I206_102862 [Kwoniella pini CBS 10737]|uniref:Conserved oligomeric Golgi complex subunit 8 n=1 Tax=Kwoniella pini CBS 10737 TaxID=1296096 RepID=A0A1B9I6K0_9TREE|nr:uncharacterized protein I206_03213 [Kwoniella pini CBS 10737]OCF51147.1 hypothetical protein I206_03213 [Kwoniella pini CBS 10737]